MTNKVREPKKVPVTTFNELKPMILKREDGVVYDIKGVTNPTDRQVLVELSKERFLPLGVLPTKGSITTLDLDVFTDDVNTLLRNVPYFEYQKGLVAFLSLDVGEDTNIQDIETIDEYLKAKKYKMGYYLELYDTTGEWFCKIIHKIDLSPKKRSKDKHTYTLLTNKGMKNYANLLDICTVLRGGSATIESKLLKDLERQRDIKPMS